MKMLASEWIPIVMTSLSAAYLRPSRPFWVWLGVDLGDGCDWGLIWVIVALFTSECVYHVIGYDVALVIVNGTRGGRTLRPRVVEGVGPEHVERNGLVDGPGAEGKCVDSPHNLGDWHGGHKAQGAGGHAHRQHAGEVARLVDAVRHTHDVEPDYLVRGGGDDEEDVREVVLGFVARGCELHSRTVCACGLCVVLVYMCVDMCVCVRVVCARACVTFCV